MCREPEKRIRKKTGENEIWSELAEIWEDRKSEPPIPTVIEIIESKYWGTKKQLVCIELIAFFIEITLHWADKIK